MEKRVLLAVALSFLVLTAYRAFLPAPAPKPVAAMAGTGGTVAAAPSSGSAPQATAPAPDEHSGTID